MLILITIMYVFYIPSVLNGKYFKTPIYDNDFRHCEKMRKSFDSVSKICIKVVL